MYQFVSHMQQFVSHMQQFVSHMQQFESHAKLFQVVETVRKRYHPRRDLVKFVPKSLHLFIIFLPFIYIRDFFQCLKYGIFENIPPNRRNTILTNIRGTK